MRKHLLLLFFISSFSLFAQKEYYELRTYSIPFNSSEQALHNYLKEVFIPALNRAGVEHVGVFEALGEPTPKQLFLLIPYKDIVAYSEVVSILAGDQQYLEERKVYDAVPHDKRVYSRFSTSFYIAFDGLPKLVKPSDGSNLFELRTYEGYSEDAVRRKVKMFNKEEFSIFDQTGLHSVFFGEQVSGPLMPALTYLLAFSSMEERNENWNKFIVHPEWKRVSVLDEYAHTVSDIKRTFLKPLSYSQL
ncbi:MAG: NIPSNAP family containing protein [Flavobacteriaceae bacterium]|nr:NIPSNAP family containing protein [Flavobacteriaceae bacterium]OUX39832.1 MAG: NIPSNAP family containing protein [Flavobacteriaceae bacterium TMED265]